MYDKQKRQQGFTLMELMMGAAILVVALSGLLHAFATCFMLNETSRNLSLALNGAQDIVEQVRNYNFDDIVTDYNNATFKLGADWFLPTADHMGVVEVINDGSDTAGITSADLLQVRVVICWKQHGGRIIGEDTDLDGVLDAGEDKSSPPNNRIDSPAELITLVSRPPS